MTAPELSIVIPTRNRQPYCIAAIEDILSYGYPRLELCIHDNSDDEEIARHIAGRKKDRRLKYKRLAGRINFVDNCNRAMEMASGKYVCMLGDDDTILPDMFDTLEWMEREGVDSVSINRQIDYYWPGAWRGEEKGILFMPPLSGVRSRVDARLRVERLFRDGIVHYMKYQLPRLYHGIVLREHMEEIRRRTGHYFGGLTPDLYSTVALSGVVSNHYVADRPMTISGACAKSATSMGSKKQDKGELHTTPYLFQKEDYAWDPAIPAYNSPSTLWAEAALKAAGEMGFSGLREAFGFPRFAAYVLITDRDIAGLVVKKLRDCLPPATKDRMATVFATAVALCALLGKKVWIRLREKFSRGEDIVRVEGVENISLASRLVRDSPHYSMNR